MEGSLFSITFKIEIINAYRYPKRLKIIILLLLILYTTFMYIHILTDIDIFIQLIKNNPI
jgi:hypothetical protein